MGLLVEGKWVDQWYDTKSTGGKFVRTVTQFRNWITPDGQAGPTGHGVLKLNQDAITSTSLLPALGPVGH